MAVRLIGGPCDGKTQPVAWYGSIYCQGVKYTLEEDGNYHVVSAPRVGFQPKAALAAWRAMNRALGVDTQRMVKRLEKAERRLRLAARK